MSSLRHFWGTEPDERLLDFPCDSFKELFDDTCYRGVIMQTNQEIIFQWLCQLRIAIYGLGRKSPPKMTPGLERLAICQEIMNIFELRIIWYRKSHWEV